MLSFAKLMRQRYNTAQSADLAVRKLRSPFDKLPQRQSIAMTAFTAFQMQHTCGLQAERYSLARSQIPQTFLSIRCAVHVLAQHSLVPSGTTGAHSVYHASEQSLSSSCVKESIRTDQANIKSLSTVNKPHHRHRW